MLSSKLIFLNLWLIIFLFAIPVKAEIIGTISCPYIVFDSTTSKKQVWDLAKDYFPKSWERQRWKQVFQIGSSTTSPPTPVYYGVSFFMQFPVTQDCRDLKSVLETKYNNFVSQGKIVKALVYLRTFENIKHWTVRKSDRKKLWLKYP